MSCYTQMLGGLLAGAFVVVAAGPREDESNLGAIDKKGSVTEGPAGRDGLEISKPGWGTLRGRFVYRGAPPRSGDAALCTVETASHARHRIADESLLIDTATRGVKNVVVYATEVSRVHQSYQHPKDEPIRFEFRECTIHPRMSVMRFDQPLIVSSRDTIPHTFTLLPPGEMGANEMLGSGEETEYRFAHHQRLPVTMSCQMCPWMRAYVLPRDNPYWAVSDETGAFEIANLPAEEKVEFRLWHEKARGADGWLQSKRTGREGRLRVSVPSGGVHDFGEVEVPSSAFQVRSP